MDRTAALQLISLEAQRARHDPDLFIESMFKDEKGRSLVQADLHRELQAFWNVFPFAVAALPREHGKTTQALGRLAHEVVNDPNIRIKIIASTDDLAAERVGVIRRTIESRPFQLRYPHIHPAKHQRWATKKFTVERTINDPNPTVMGSGILASETGGRADLLLFDDPVSMRNALTHPGERKAVIDAFYNDWFPMLTPDGRLWYLGTPWHEADLTSRLMRADNEGFRLFTRRVSDDLISPWPAMWPVEALQLRQQQMPAGAFARAYYLRPVAEADVVCHEDWIIRDGSGPGPVVVLGIDPAISQREVADWFSISVLEVHGSFGLLRDVIRVRCSFPDQVRLVMETRKAMKPQIIAVETVAYQRALKEELQARGCTEVMGVHPVTEKRARFSLLGLRCQQGSLRVADRDTPGLQAFIDELTGFPAAEHDDTLDSTVLAMGAAEQQELFTTEAQEGMGLSDYGLEFV